MKSMPKFDVYISGKELKRLIKDSESIGQTGDLVRIKAKASLGFHHIIPTLKVISDWLYKNRTELDGIETLDKFKKLKVS